MTPVPVVLIPAFNAEGSIADVVEKSRKQAPGAVILVVDDGSLDRTAALAEGAGARVVRHSVNSGKGAALRTGFQTVLREYQCDVVITLDADLQHDPSDIPRFLETYEKGARSVVVGRRSRWKTSMPVSRKISNTLTSFLVSVRTGARIADSQCGFRLIGREVLERVKLDANGFEAETEFLIKAAKNGFPIAFIPIQTLYAHETSNMTHWTTTKQFIKTLFRKY